MDEIQDENLIMHSKWKSPGQFASGTTTVNVPGVTIANNTSQSFETTIPFDSSLFATAQVYYQSTAYPGYWQRTPDTFTTPSPDFMPVNVAGVIQGNNLKIRVTYRNTFGPSITITARTLTFRYFLFV